MPAGTFDPSSPEAAYAFKGNIRYPGTQAQATAAETAAAARLHDSIPSITFTTTGTIKVAT